MEKEVKKELEETLKIQILENEYVIKLPNTGDLIDMEMRKSRYVMDNNYISGIFAEMLAKAIATFSVLIPELKKDLNIESFEKMSLKDSKVIVKVYRDQFLPWWNDWMEEIGSVFGDD